MRHVCIPRRSDCDGCIEQEAESRLRGACLAMSRFLVWVWMEAAAAWNHGDNKQMESDWLSRSFRLYVALNDGRLKLTYPEETP